MLRRAVLMTVVALSACGPVEFRIDESKGVPTLSGSTEVDLGSFTCGETLPAGDQQVKTRVVTGGCEFTFDDSIEVLKASDYSAIGELSSTANLVQRVELNIKKLDFLDGAGSKLDLQTGITSVTLSFNGQQVADKAALASLPRVVSLEGASLATLKAQIDARQNASVAVKAIAVLPDSPPPPAKLKISYDAQPALIIGPGKIF